ncbi:MAG TPA: 3-dehydroquinate synthase [Gemmatimonadaceae bacterium]|nr:3-dehydroquinate synthase [Gemmatimonadaceae bacterium]
MSGAATPTVHEIELATYRVTVAAGALDRVAERARAATGAYRFAILTDSTVAALYAQRVMAGFAADEARLLAFPPGEREKSRERWSALTDEMLALGFGRDAAVIALGGGVVGDLAGFVAATYMRGLPFVQVPTTLLAMIDSSIGGKTGVDTPAGKNLVGAFHQPAAVMADPLALGTLPPPQLRAGLAEAIKHGVIADRRYLQRTVEALPTLVSAGGAGTLAMEELIARSIAIKADVASRDERESGVRKILNFGHTIGHAIELLSGYSLLHGEAVAIGMVLEARLAERLGIAESGTAAAVAEAVSQAGLPASRPAAIAPELILEATRSDKKARRGAVEYALPRRIGEMAGEERGWCVPVDDAAVLETLAS